MNKLPAESSSSRFTEPYRRVVANAARKIGAPLVAVSAMLSVPAAVGAVHAAEHQPPNCETLSLDPANWIACPAERGGSAYETSQLIINQAEASLTQ